MSNDFILTDEQAILRDGAWRWVSERDPRAPDDIAVSWAHFAEMGWLMAGLPEDVGGLGGGLSDSAIVAEALGRGLVRAPFVEVAIVAARLLAAVAPEQVAALAEGDVRPLLAHDEPGARGDADWIETQAESPGGEWRLTGRKVGLVGADQADSFLVSARMHGGGTALFAVARAAATLRTYRTIDDRGAGELLLDATPAVLLAGPDMAAAALAEACDLSLIGESAEAIGAMERAFEMTRDYLLTRKQFGQLIGEFQALRHRLADMFIELEQARSIVLRAIGAAQARDAGQRALLAAATKARVAQAGLFVGAQAIQLHGGIGVTDEYPVGHYFKRLLAFDRRHGGGEIQVERFAALSGALSPADILPGDQYGR